MTTIAQQGRNADVGQIVFDLSHNRIEPLAFVIEVVYPNSSIPANYTEPEVAFNNGSTYTPVVNGAFSTPANTRYINFRFKINNDNRTVDDNYVRVRLAPGPGNTQITNTEPLEVSFQIIDGLKGSTFTQDAAAADVFETQSLETDYAINPPLIEDTAFKVQLIAGTGSELDVQTLEYTLDGFDFFPLVSGDEFTLVAGTNGFSIRLTPVHQTVDYDDRTVILRMSMLTLGGKVTNKTITIKNTDNHPAGELITAYCQGFERWGTYHDGNGGTYDEIIEEDSPLCGFVHPAQGTVLREFCAGYDLMQHVADGQGGYTVRTDQFQSNECGWTPPVPNPQTEVTPTKFSTANKGPTVTLTEDDRVFSASQRDGAYSLYSTMANKWYWEVEIFFPTDFHKAPAIGVVTASHPKANWIGSNQHSWAWWPLESRAYWNDLESPYGSPIESGDVVSVLLDTNARTLEFWLNGVSQGIAFTNLPEFVKFLAATNANEESYSRNNFGQWEFKYVPPSGFLPGFGTIATEPVERGTDLGLSCNGVDRIRSYADGRYGTYFTLVQANNTDCGYVPPPPAAGTTLGYVCVGTSYYRRVADGSGGETQVLVQHYSPTCGYVPPPTPAVTFATLNPGWLGNGTVLSNGNKTALLDSSVDSTTYIESGRWYWEVVPTTNEVAVGLLPVSYHWNTVAGMGPGSFAWSLATQELIIGGVKTLTTSLPVVQAGDVVGMYVDYAMQTLQFSLNDVLVGPAISIDNTRYWFGASNYLNTGPVSITVRFVDTEITGTPPGAFIKGFGTPNPLIGVKGTIITYWCVGYNRWARYHDGVGGTYDQLFQANSTTCGYVPPRPAGELKNYLCKGEQNTDRYAVYHDGNYGTYETLLALRSPACGYLSFGTLISTSCDGTTKKGTYSDGEFGSYVEIIEANSVECGYNSGGPPTAPPPGSVDPTLPVTSTGALVFSSSALHTNGELIFKP